MTRGELVRGGSVVIGDIARVFDGGLDAVLWFGLGGRCPTYVAHRSLRRPGAVQVTSLAVGDDGSIVALGDRQYSGLCDLVAGEDVAMGHMYCAMAARGGMAVAA